MAVAPTRDREAPTRHPRDGERRTLLRGVGWDGYQALLEWFGDDAPRMNYALGDVEIMSPHVAHEEFERSLGFVVETIIEEGNLPCRSLGSVTLFHPDEDRAVEPDECYYLRENARRVTSRRRIDLSIDPPPDLAIEIEQSRSILPKLDLYARLGFPELWRYDGNALTVLRLDPDGTYREVGASGAVPVLSLEPIRQFLRDITPGEETAWRRRFRAWVRDALGGGAG